MFSSSTYHVSPTSLLTYQILYFQAAYTRLSSSETLIESTLSSGYKFPWDLISMNIQLISASLYVFDYKYEEGDMY